MKKNLYAFGTNLYIQFDHEFENQIIEEIIDKIYSFDDEMSLFKKDSVVTKINEMAGIDSVEVSNNLLDIIEKSIKYSDITNGYLDITCKPITELVKQGKYTNEDILNKQKLINYKDILVNKKENKIMLKYEGMGIDLGSMVKGYTTDIIVDILNKYNVSNALIDLGGNIFVKGLNNNCLWKVGIQEPFGISFDSICVLNISNKSVVTSGNYERKNHIISPKTGFPINDQVLSVTIISDKSIDAEGLSTACYVMGIEEGIKLLDSLKNIDYIFITGQKEIYCSNKIKENISLLSKEYILV